MKITVKGKQIELQEDAHYKGEGGFAKIYVKGSTAFKIYKDLKDMIPAGKIRELAQLQLPNVYAPRDVVYDMQGREVGFTMNALEKNEYIIKLFSNKFRTTNSISPQMIVEIVKQMQLTMAALHRDKFLVVDCNVMNFLVDEHFKIPLFIDVDSYCTPSYPTNIIMLTFRDRKTVGNNYNELTDWFSFGLVAFNIYTGTHPYAGKNPSYTGENRINEMLDANVSVLSNGMKLPGGTQDLSVIPPAHLDWFKRIFVNGERSAPPLPDQILAMPTPTARIIGGNEKFEVTLLETYASDIQGIVVSNALRYVLTDYSVFQEKKEILKFQSKDKKRGIVSAMGDTFAIAEYNKQLNRVLFCNDKREKIGEVEADNFTVGNGCFYTITNGSFVEHSFINMGVKLIHQVVVVGNAFGPTVKLFQNVALQDVLGKCFALIPFGKGQVSTIPLPELNGHRFVDAKFEKKFLIVFSEKSGKYYRTVFVFDTKTLKYTVRMDNPSDSDSISFTVLENSLCILAINDSRIELFFDNNNVKMVDKPPFDSEDQLYSEGNSVMVIKSKNLYKIKLK